MRRCKLCDNEFKPHGRELLCTRDHFYECVYCHKLIKIRTWKDFTPVQLELFRQDQCEVIEVNENKVVFKFTSVFEFDGACKKCRREHPELVNAAALGKAKETWAETLGTDNPMRSPVVKEKSKISSLKKYGVDNPAKSPIVQAKIEKTNLEKRGVKSVLADPEFRKKICEDYKKETGFDNPMRNPAVKKKAKNTIKERYGVECTLVAPEVKAKKEKTWLEKYGVAHPMQNESIKKKAKQTYKKKTGFDNPSQNPEVIEKRRRNYHAKTGFDYPAQDPVVQAKASATYKRRTGFDHPSQNPEIARKKAKTARKNGNRSSLEDMVVNKLSELGAVEYVDFEQEYYDEVRYPFSCDFYFPKSDTFLEINGHWSHGGHWFNKDDKSDIDKLNEWKEKNTKFYDNAINTWTVRDVLKRETAVVNNLSYVVLWSKQEVAAFCVEVLPSLI